MRAVLVIGLVGCVGAGSSDPVDPLRHDPDDPAHCDGLPVCQEGYVCAVARYGCLPADEVYAIRVTWTVAGQLATNTSCAAQPELTIEFTADQSSTGLVFSPVPCAVGRYTLARTSRSVNEASLLTRARDAQPQYAKVDPVTGDVAIDLAF